LCIYDCLVVIKNQFYFLFFFVLDGKGFWVLDVLCLILNLGMVCVLEFGFKGKEVTVLCWHRRQHRKSDCGG
jgi:hypothetical protein